MNCKWYLSLDIKHIYTYKHIVIEYILSLVFYLFTARTPVYVNRELCDKPLPFVRGITPTLDVTKYIYFFYALLLCVLYFLKTQH